MASRKDNKGRVLNKGEVQLKDLRYLYTFSDSFGRRRYVYAKSLKELREKEEQITRDRMDGIDSYTSKNVKVNQVFDRYFSTKINLRESTRANYSYMYDHYVRNTLGKRSLLSVKYSDVKMFYQYLFKEKHLQANTIEIVHRLLYSAFNMAVRDDLLRNNPVDGAMKELKQLEGNDKGVRHALTLEQQRAFLNYMSEEPKYCRWYPFFAVLLGTGLRIGEISGLRWQDVDFEKRLISINHSMVYCMISDSRKNMFKVSRPKTEAGKRVVPMMESVYNVLKQEYDYQKRNGFSDIVVDGMTGFIFVNQQGKINYSQTANRVIKRAVNDYNAKESVAAAEENREEKLLPEFSCHHLRHTFCTRLCETETNIKVIQDVMGHANIGTTMDIYAEATIQKKTEAIANLAHKLDFF